MDLTIQAMSGIMNATGFPDRAPVKAGPAVCDFLGGVHLCAGILGALVQRARTGRGQFVEVAMLDAAIIALASALGVFMDGDTSVPPRTGNRHPALAMAPYNVYETSDGHVAIFTASDRHWESITKVLGREDLLTNPDYATTPGRAARVEEIDAMVTTWTRARTKNDVMAIMTEAHVPCAPVRTAAEVVADPHLGHRASAARQDEGADLADPPPWRRARGCRSPGAAARSGYRPRAGGIARPVGRRARHAPRRRGDRARQDLSNAGARFIVVLGAVIRL